MRCGFIFDCFDKGRRAKDHHCAQAAPKALLGGTEFRVLGLQSFREASIGVLFGVLWFIMLIVLKGGDDH